ncbi:hypothetical protein EDD15DRAFT_2336753 [Pisolithus albus]|nr:hypothetical protein EDD15DRAFT_2336753 [Pisolithus albus]
MQPARRSSSIKLPTTRRTAGMIGYERSLLSLSSIRFVESCGQQSSVVEYVAFNCQSQQNAHGGNCVASDQSWFIQ